MFRVSLFFVIAFSIAARAESITVKNCKVKFETTGQPVLVKIEGKSEVECTGKVTVEGDQIKDSEFSMSVEHLDTGIALRNKHLRENYLHTEKFPTAKLSIKAIDGLSTQRKGPSAAMNDFQAELELHGQKAPVEIGKYQIKDNKVTTQFCIDLPSYGVDKPSFMGVKIVDKVHITVTFDI
jgi:polyisoprenoid-binding protein YceI